EHDQLTVAAEPVERVDGGDQQRDRRYQSNQVRQRQGRHNDEGPGVLSLRGDDIELAQGQRDPDDTRQRQENQQQRSRDLPEQVTAEGAHGPPGSPSHSYASMKLVATAPAAPCSARWPASHSTVAEIRLRA